MGLTSLLLLSGMSGCRCAMQFDTLSTYHWACDAECFMPSCRSILLAPAYVPPACLAWWIVPGLAAYGLSLPRETAPDADGRANVLHSEKDMRGPWRYFDSPQDAAVAASSAEDASGEAVESSQAWVQAYEAALAIHPENEELWCAYALEHVRFGAGGLSCCSGVPADRNPSRP